MWRNVYRWPSGEYTFGFSFGSREEALRRRWLGRNSTLVCVGIVHERRP